MLIEKESVRVGERGRERERVREQRRGLKRRKTAKQNRSRTCGQKMLGCESPMK